MLPAPDAIIAAAATAAVTPMLTAQGVVLNGVPLAQRPLSDADPWRAEPPGEIAETEAPYPAVAETLGDRPHRMLLGSGLIVVEYAGAVADVVANLVLVLVAYVCARITGGSSTVFVGIGLVGVRVRRAVVALVPDTVTVRLIDVVVGRTVVGHVADSVSIGVRTRIAHVSNAVPISVRLIRIGHDLTIVAC